MMPPAAIIVVFRLTFPFTAVVDVVVVTGFDDVTIFCDATVALSSIMVPVFCGAVASGWSTFWRALVFRAGDERCEIGVPPVFETMPFVLLLFILFGGEDCCVVGGPISRL